MCKHERVFGRPRLMDQSMVASPPPPPEGTRQRGQAVAACNEETDESTWPAWQHTACLFVSAHVLSGTCPCLLPQAITQQTARATVQEIIKAPFACRSNALMPAELLEYSHQPRPSFFHPSLPLPPTRVTGCSSAQAFNTSCSCPPPWLSKMHGTVPSCARAPHAQRP